MFGQERQGISGFDLFKKGLNLNQEYSFMNTSGFNTPKGIIKGRLIQINENDCVFEVLENIGTGDIQVTNNQCTVMISNLFMSVGEFNRFNALGNATSLARANEQNIAGILSANLKPIIENKTYTDEKANMLEGHEALQKSWDIYKEEKTKDPPPFSRENPRIILRALIGRISSFLNIDIKPEDINLVSSSMKLCKDYYDYDIEKIRGFAIDTEYQELLIKIKAKGI